jgi:adenylate cyclase
MFQLAADVEVLVGNQLGRPGDTEYELAHRYADGGRVLAPFAVPLISSVFSAHLRERMRDIFVTPEEAELGSLRAETDVAVAFIDVVGFSGLGERVAAGHLMTVAANLLTLAEAVVELPVRIVKTIGDALLLMSRDGVPLVDALVKINENANASESLPPVHTGVAFGRAYIGGADVYGAPVNLASRLTDLAPAGRIWADAAFVRASGDVARWAAIGVQEVKGLTDPVEVYEARP